MNLTIPSYKKILSRLTLKYMNSVYRVGWRLDRRGYRKLSSMLYQADVEMTPGMFLSLCYVTAGLSGVALFAASDLFLTFVMETDLALPLSVGVGAVTFFAVVIAFFFYLVNRINTKKLGLERDLPFALSYMSIMSSAGSTPLKVLAALSIQNYGYISSEFRKMGYRVYFLGEDSITAINNLANKTPSATFRDICLELGNIIHTGTGMKEFLSEQSANLIEVRKRVIKEFTEDISLFSELYLLVILSTIFAIIIIPLTSVFGISFGFFGPDSMFMIFTYILLPFMNIGFLAMLEAKYSSLP
ncbi:MAG: type II secretion system F family protein [Candidatus Altiarchaeota archaeon]|nr:type II secretion system F family protein [Candidatus Altiarchaeota archaeon]